MYHGELGNPAPLDISLGDMYTGSFSVNTWTMLADGSKCRTRRQEWRHHSLRGVDAGGWETVLMHSVAAFSKLS